MSSKSDFQAVVACSWGLQINHLQHLAAPFPGTSAQSWHTKSLYDSLLAHCGKQPTWPNSSNSSKECFILSAMTKEYLGVDDSLLESAAKCLDAESVRALGALQLADAAQSRLESLAEKANEGQLTAEEAHEYDRFIEVGDIIATLRLKAERQMQVARG